MLPLIKEFLVTAQAYAKDDSHKQTILLHDTFFEKDEDSAETQFLSKFSSDYNIVKVFSSIDITTN